MRQAHHPNNHMKKSMQTTRISGAKANIATSESSIFIWFVMRQRGNLGWGPGQAHKQRPGHHTLARAQRAEINPKSEGHWKARFDAVGGDAAHVARID
jgi:hypothetical protein